MPLELTARTAAGARLLALADALAEDFATRAAAHDRDGSYPHASIDALKDANYFAAPIPAEYGGLGVDCVHDLVLASSRLARGDASVAIGVNMHLVAVLNMVRRWRIAVAGGHVRRAAAFAASMREIARERVVMAAAVSEPGQDLTRPKTTATRADGGWRIHGRKIFCTMSPAATTLYTAVTFDDEQGAERYGYALVPVDARGVIVHDDWDALGMRASGSNSVTFDDVELPDSVLRGGFPLATRPRTWSATSSRGCFTPRPRSASPRRPSSRRSPRSPPAGAAQRTRGPARWPPRAPSSSGSAGPPWPAAPA